ncbi:MAG: 6-bladed beta-propeller [Gammaproteobacteria bacterium]|nr:6-bladed beta-propeller [Gammaproteobacteria bacterium]
MKKFTEHFLLGVAAIGMALLTACAGTSQISASDGSLFYPSPPAPARLQYLTKFSSQLDLGEKNARFRDFVFGEETISGHLVQKPYGLAVFEGAAYVVDTRGGGYVVFDFLNSRSKLVRGNGASNMPKPINITIDTDGTRYVTDTQREQVLVFDRNDRFVKAFGSSGQFRPVDVAIVDDRLYISDILHHTIQVLDQRTGQLLFKFGSNGSGPGELFQPTNLAIGPDGSVYVTDTGNFRIQVFSPDGEFIRSIGKIGTAAGRFARPKGIAVDREGRVYVVDAAFANVQILDATGTPLMFFGEPGTSPGNINLPTVVKIDYENVEFFQQYADPEFRLEYLVLVASQFGVNKVAVFGYGTMRE